ncbi:ABC transporter permease [Granulicella mallensis]|jgi:ABC-2 type transport system permease protein|uniref:Transport permease protein n=1 Tax=Granulicella mallensis (strain ATCC BAA-1857 / DSM 23137 / MP5ACTX8) TaxID=682795 RepID=G8NST0_GRAMM|nr:ABC transporter permease [Granulicella mallensis]AEU35179.1 ABC transporter, permease protein [Granulicella mallensis MP5ACTX8]
MAASVAVMSETGISRRTSYTRAFGGLMLRDLRVLMRELGPFLVRVAMNPLLFLFIFTYVMPHMSGGAALNPTAQMAGATGGSFGTVLLPGLMAVAIMFSGIAAVALPLAQEFGITREIDDRVMCPLPIAAVAAEKIIFSALQSLIAAAGVFPLAYYIPSTPVMVHVSNWFFLAAVLVLASLLAGALGLTIGTSVQPKQIGLIFGVVVMPITFLGCVYYPWAALAPIRWMQLGVLVNPIVYMSEGLRAALTPTLGHMPEAMILLMLCFFLVLLTWLGMKGFRRRVLS